MQVVKKHISKSSFVFILMLGTSYLFAQNVNTLASPLDLLMPLSKMDSTLIENESLLINPKVYSVSKLPIFCKIEHKLGKNAGYNLKMRLGDVDYVDRLEGKGIKKER